MLVYGLAVIFFYLGTTFWTGNIVVMKTTAKADILSWLSSSYGIKKSSTIIFLAKDNYGNDKNRNRCNNKRNQYFEKKCKPYKDRKKDCKEFYLVHGTTKKLVSCFSILDKLQIFSWYFSNNIVYNIIAF